MCMATKDETTSICCRSRKVLLNDVINIIGHSQPEVAYRPWISWVHTQRRVVKPVILVSLEKVRYSIHIAKDSIYWRRDSIPVIPDWTWVAWVYSVTCFIVAVVPRPQEKIDKPIWPTKGSVNSARPFKMKLKKKIRESHKLRCKHWSYYKLLSGSLWNYYFFWRVCLCARALTFIK